MPYSTSSISASDLKDLIEKGCCLVDVREPIEYGEERIQGSKSIPLGEIGTRNAEISRSSPIVVMCRSGKRGSEALKKLESLGIENVQNLDGGILAWKQTGFPTEKSARKVLPLMQQVQITIGLGVLTGVILARLVDSHWIFLSGFFGAGLVFAGTTGWCGLAILMSKMPWNRMPSSSCCSTGSCKGN